ncbi:MAG: single-stranded-DNA-specific exonuclease RecJ [Alphaproteobacteria bacterium]|nr:single-stranded-DNA-specific exonuclease RecJ [Alphaproteobacteria bacterium]
MSALGRDAVATAAFLGVERSLTGRRWLSRAGDERLAAAISQRLGAPEVVGRVLAARGVAPDDAEAFLNPTLRDLLPDPGHLKGMDAAAARVARAVETGERIAVFGDYDVDGATSSALLERFLGAVGGVVRVYIPDRVVEGYGPNGPALRRLRAEGCALVLTVDCGTTAFEALAEAESCGLEVIVVDHHAAEARLPAAIAVVNPNRIDDASPHKHLAAVGVCFLLAVAVNRLLRERGWYAQRPAPDLMRWLDIVALGTVCDVVPLAGINRALVAQGLKVMAKRGNAGLAALADVAGMRERPEAWHLGYALGPRVNAGGRVGEAGLGARLLATDDPTEAATIAARLDEHNRERQQIEAVVLLAAIEQVETTPAAAASPLVLAAGEGWHPGVIGIVASRLKDRYNRPACVVAIEGGEAKGSGRSVRGLDLGAAVIAARQAGILTKGGGHAMAAGFSLDPQRLPELRAFLDDRLSRQAAGELVPTLELDGALDCGGATRELVETIARCGPFGAGNEEPRFVISAARVSWSKAVGTGHVSCTLAGAGNTRLKAIAFRCMDGPLGQALLNPGPPLHLAGTLRLETWQGETSVKLHIDDAAPAR